MFNVRNNVTVIGHVTAPARIIEHENGDRTAFITVMAQNNFQSTRGNKKDYHSEAIEGRIYIKKAQKNYIERVPKGAFVVLEGRLSKTPYEKDGETVYPPLEFVLDKITPIEKSKNGY